jgi:predicted ATP-dependent serine protease
MNVKKLSEIEAKPIPRNSTFFHTLDVVYGKSDLPVNNIGMPKGKISLWAGESGVGKSRLCIEVSKMFSTNYNNGVVLYFQTESPLSDFASWAKNTDAYDKIYCSGEDRIDEIIKIIYKIQPKLVFIDSVNEIEEFENGNKKEAKRLIKGVNGMPGLKQVTHDVGCHTILLGQLNQDGKTIKGGTSLPHLVDVALKVVWIDEQLGTFKVEVGQKHRHGSRENVALFRHNDDGVSEHIVYAPTPVSVPVPVDPNSLPSNVYMGSPVKAPYYDYSGRLWTVGIEKRYQQLYNSRKEEMIASGEIKVDNNGRVIPKDSRGLLTKLNQGVGKVFGLE